MPNDSIPTISPPAKRRKTHRRNDANLSGGKGVAGVVGQHDSELVDLYNAGHSPSDISKILTRRHSHLNADNASSTIISNRIHYIT